MAEEWYRDAHKQADAEALTRAEKLKVADQARSSAEAGLKTAERQAED